MILNESASYYQRHRKKLLSRAKRYYQDHKQVVKANVKKWQHQNTEKCKTYLNNWRSVNKSKVKAQNSRYYSAHVVKEKDRSNKYRFENPEVIRAINRNRRARVRQAIGSLSKDEWQQIRKRYNNTCPRCRKKEPEIKLTVDHIIPLLYGGPHSIINVQPLCYSCNSRKRLEAIKYQPVCS